MCESTFACVYLCVCASVRMRAHALDRIIMQSVQSQIHSLLLWFTGAAKPSFGWRALRRIWQSYAFCCFTSIYHKFSLYWQTQYIQFVPGFLGGFSPWDRENTWAEVKHPLDSVRLLCCTESSSVLFSTWTMTQHLGSNVGQRSRCFIGIK